MKSLLPQAFAVSDVHPRLRKCLSRCTLDCGFKTPESPALRGFEAERCPITGTSLYLVLKSNGLRHLKNPPVKFDFLPIDTPANIAKKLPSQRCSQPFLIAFSTSRTNGPRLPSPPKAGTHSPFGKRSHTRAHTAKQGPSLPRPQCGFVLPAKSLLFHRAFIYIHFPVLYEPSTPAEEKNPAKLPPQRCSKPLFIAFFNTSGTNAPCSLSLPKAGTHSVFRERSRTSAYTPKHGAFWVGALLLPSDCFTRFGTPAWSGGKTAYFAPLRSGSRVLPKNAKSLRDSDALMCVAVPRRRGPAGLRDLFATW